MASMLRDPKIAFIILHTSFAADSGLTAELEHGGGAA